MKQIVSAVLLLTLPARLALADATAGRAVYDRACKSCHSASGAANPAIAKMMKVEMKDLGSADVQAHSDADLKKVITDGQGKMKPIKTVMGKDIDDVIAYVRTLKK
jgi:mono/diheme cytochrome c family protein